ncbi:MAG: HDOD domain-containing protein [Candidatus Krumholzibacteriota bacterium]|nr:HDOD domain-containing protein [Candidatus Krumholzibacteriota bacterium]
MTQNVSINKLIMLTGDLPPMPYVARKVMEVVNKPSTNAETLQEIISKDQGLSSHILKIANSALYAVSRRIETLTDAIVMLGFNSIRTLAIMSATKNLHNFAKRGKILGLKDKLMWEHSVAAAIASRMIAQHVNSSHVENAFMAGLLHDIGKLVILQKLNDDFNQIVEEVYNTGRHFSEVEEAILGFTHAEVGALLMKKWKFSEEFEEAVQSHHSVTSELGPNRQLVFYIDLANKMCHKLGVGFIREPDLDLSAEISAIRLGIKNEELIMLEDSVKMILQQERSVFL